MKFEFPEINKISFESKEAVAYMVDDPDIDFTQSDEPF